MFLAISALLFVGLLGGVSFAVQRQRYSDSVQSTLSFLQKQFNETVNVVNGRDVDPCAPDGAGAPIGASRCFVMGKEILFYPGTGSQADRVEVSSVVGAEPASSPETPSLRSYFERVARGDGNRQELLIPWGAQVVSASVVPIGGGAVQPVDRVLLLRSPDSGATQVYAFGSDPATVSDFEAGRVSKERPVVLCLRSQGVGSVAAVVFDGAGSQDGVTADFEQEGQPCGA